MYSKTMDEQVSMWFIPLSGLYYAASSSQEVCGYCNIVIMAGIFLLIVIKCKDSVL
jgi:hypothetical protein